MLLSYCQRGFFLLLFPLISACTTTLSTEVNTLHQWVPPQAGKSYAFSEDFSQNLEKKSYADLISTAMQKTGLRLIQDAQQADYLLSFETKVQKESVQEIYEEPLMMPSLVYGMGYDGMFGSLFYMPRLYTHTTNYYDYTLNLTISQALGRPLYQVTVTAESTHPHLSEMMPYLVHAAFEGFPANSAKVRKITFDVDKSKAAHQPILYQKP